MPINYKQYKKRTGSNPYGQGGFGFQTPERPPLLDTGSSTTIPGQGPGQPGQEQSGLATPNRALNPNQQFGIGPQPQYSPQEEQANRLQPAATPFNQSRFGNQVPNLTAGPPQPQGFTEFQQQPTVGGFGAAPQPQPQQFSEFQQQPTIGGEAPAGPPQPAGPQPPVQPPIGPDVGPPQPAGYQTTELGDEATKQYSKYALGDEDPDVTAQRQRLEREQLNRVEQAKREAHQEAGRRGYSPGHPIYEKMMNNAESSARNANIEAQNAFGDFARGRRSDRQRELAQISETEFGRAERGRTEAWSDFNQIVKFLPSDAAQQELMRKKLGGQDIKEAFRNMYQPDGTLKAEYRDLSKVELIKKGISDAFGAMTTNPDTGKPFASDAERKAAEDKFYDDNFENILFPAQTQAGQREEQQATQGRIDAFLDGGPISAMGESDWKAMTGPQIDKAVASDQMQKFESSQTYFRQSDFEKSGLKADAVQTVVDDGAPSKAASSAGEGNGSIIVYNGQPMRITRYSSKKDTTLKNERIGRVYAVPLKGGKEVEISSTGWRDL